MIPGWLKTISTEDQADAAKKAAAAAAASVVWVKAEVAGDLPRETIEAMRAEAEALALEARGAAVAANSIRNARFSAGTKKRMEVPFILYPCTFLRLLLTASGYTVIKNVQYFDDSAAVKKYSPPSAPPDVDKPSVLIAVLLLSDFAGQCVRYTENAGDGPVTTIGTNKFISMKKPCISHDECDAGACVYLRAGDPARDAARELQQRRGRQHPFNVAMRRGAIAKNCVEQHQGRAMPLGAERKKVLKNCAKQAQRQVFSENVLWKWLFTTNAKKVLGGLLRVQWMEGEKTMKHSMAFYRCDEMGEVRIYICNTWGGRCSWNDVNAEEFHDFLGDAILSNESINILITSITCIVAEKRWWIGTLTGEERRINALGEHVRQELLGENE